MRKDYGPLLDRPDSIGLAANVLAALAAVTVVNGILFFAAPMPTGTQASADPPGFLVGMVWTCLFVLMGAARWRLGAVRSSAFADRRWVVTAFAVFCLAYPFYAILPGNAGAGLIGNVATVVLGLSATALAYGASRAAALLILPVVPWVAYASFLLWTAPR